MKKQHITVIHCDLTSSSWVFLCCLLAFYRRSFWSGHEDVVEVPQKVNALRWFLHQTHHSTFQKYTLQLCFSNRCSLERSFHSVVLCSKRQTSLVQLKQSKVAPPCLSSIRWRHTMIQTASSPHLPACPAILSEDCTLRQLLSKNQQVSLSGKTIIFLPRFNNMLPSDNGAAIPSIHQQKNLNKSPPTVECRNSLELAAGSTELGTPNYQYEVSKVEVHPFFAIRHQKQLALGFQIFEKVPTVREKWWLTVEASKVGNANKSMVELSLLAVWVCLGWYLKFWVGSLFEIDC